MNRTDLPADYKPYRELELCSNHFVNTPVALEVDGHLPLLAGMGDGPRIWLYAPTAGQRERWTLVVADNKPSFPGLAVRMTGEHVLEVLAGNTRVLAVSETSSDSAAISFLDLRPLGLNIHGDSTALWIGTNQFSRNRIENCATGIGIGL